MPKVYVDKTNTTIVGVDNFHFSVVENDYPDFIQYGEMYNYPGSIEITATPENINETLYADNTAVIVYTATSSVAVSLERTNLNDDILAVLMGSAKEGAIRHINSAAKSPYVGIAWRQTYSDGTYGWVKLFKGKFQEPANAARTREDSVDFQTRTLEGTFGETRFLQTFDGKAYPLLMASVTENAEGYVAEGDTWFDEILPTTAKAWTASTAYGRGNHVSHDGKFYRAVTSHTSSEAFATDTANWAEVE